MGNDAKTHPHSNTKTICGLLDQHTTHLRHWQDWSDFVAFNSAPAYQFEPSPQSAYTHLQKTQSGHSLHLFLHTILKVLPLTRVKTFFPCSNQLSDTCHGFSRCNLALDKPDVTTGGIIAASCHLFVWSPNFTYLGSITCWGCSYECELVVTQKKQKKQYVYYALYYVYV